MAAFIRTLLLVFTLALQLQLQQGAKLISPGRLLKLHRRYRGLHLSDLQNLRLRDKSRHRRFLSGAETYPLGGIADPILAGLYYTELQLGTPPSKFYVQVDTGSDLLWLNCASCTTCPTSTDLGVPLQLYDPASSSSSSIIHCGDETCKAVSSAGCQTGQPCSYVLEYGDGSSSQGYYVQDTLQLDIVAGNQSAKSGNATVFFGCGTTQGGELQQAEQALDGIMGFGQSNFSVVSQLSNQNQAPGVFAHCLEGEGEGGGILVIGQVQAPGLVYTSIIPNQPHYNVNLQSIAVNDLTIPINSAVSSSNGNSGTIIDSGTTLAYFADTEYQQLIAAILSGLPQELQVSTWQGLTCIYNAGSIDEFPSVTLTFDGNGATMVIKPQEYLIQADGTPGGWCIGFQNPSQSSLGLNILGDLVLKDRLVVYDLEHQRIGWVDYNCSSSVNVISSTGQLEKVTASYIQNVTHSCGTAVPNIRILLAIIWLCLFLHLS